MLNAELYFPKYFMVPTCICLQKCVFLQMFFAEMYFQAEIYFVCQNLVFADTRVKLLLRYNVLAEVFLSPKYIYIYEFQKVSFLVELPFLAKLDVYR